MERKHCTLDDGPDSQLSRSSELQPSWVAWIKSDRVAQMDSSPEILARAFYIEDLLLCFHLLLGKITIQAVWDCNNGQIGLSRRRGGRGREEETCRVLLKRPFQVLLTLRWPKIKSSNLKCQFSVIGFSQNLPLSYSLPCFLVFCSPRYLLRRFFFFCMPSL